MIAKTPKVRFSILRQIPTGIWVMGFVSLLTDISLEMVHSVLPIFMTTTIGASVMMVGFIEGGAEALSHIVKVFSGSLSDYWGKRKGLVVFGYSLNVVAKPIMALASSVGMVVLSRIIDRLGRGIRGAPRDALIADITPPKIRGASFGLRETLDGIGELLGPLLAFVLLAIWANNFQIIFWVAAIPAVLAVVLLIFGLKEPESPHIKATENPLKIRQLKKLGTHYWWIVLIFGFLMLARFSDAFLVLKATEVGFELSDIPLILVVWNLSLCLSAYPMGKLADGVIEHHYLFIIGLISLVFADAILTLSHHWSSLIIAVILWGFHLGTTQGLINNMIAHTVPSHLRGTGYGVFNLIRGVAMLIASGLAGIIWDSYGSSWTFFTSLIFALISIGLAVFYFFIFLKNKNSQF